MATEVRMPQWGMGMSEGTITKWLVAVGDTVEEGQALVEVETAKAEGEIESPIAGTISKLLVDEDDEVPVQDVIAIIDEA